VYVLAKYQQFAPLCDVKIGEALELLSALNWVVKIELDSKVVVDKFHSSKSDDTKLGEIVSHRKRLFFFFVINYNNFSVKW
jgi:hypothetical protein